MADEPLTPEQMAEEHRRQLAAQEAASYLASQGVPGYSAPPPAMSAATEPPPQEFGPPAPTAQPTAPSKGWEGAKRGALQGLANVGSMAVAGPIGPALAGLVATPAPPRKEEAPAPVPDGEPFGPPAPAGGEDPPLILSRPGGPGGMVSPAGMYPHSMTTQAHMGRPVPGEAKGAFGASTALGLEGAQLQRDADHALYKQVGDLAATKMRATEDARAQHARVQVERDSLVRQRLAQIEATNAEAAAAIEPNKYWVDRGAGAAILGAIAVGLGEYASKMGGGPNTALRIFENGVNREIQAQLANRQSKEKLAGRQVQLLDLHLGRLGDKDKEIDATKLALWDNIGTQIEAYKAQHGAAVSDANLANLQAGILEKRGELVNKIGLQEADDINKQYSEQWHNAQVIGGAGGTPAGKMDGLELIPVPASDQTSEKGKYIAVPKDTHKDLSAAVGFSNAIVGINQDALRRIKEIQSDMDLAKKGDTGAISRINANRKTLADLAQRKASFMSTAESQGVLKEAEFDRAMADRAHFTDWWKPGANVEKRIQAQNNGLMGAAGARIKGAGGQEVRMAYTRDKNGALQPTPLFTGRMYSPAPVMPETGPEK